MVPKVGKKVGFLREQGTAIILEIRGKRALVEDSDGFERELLISELIELHSPGNLRFDELESAKESIEKLKGIVPTRQEQKAKISRQHLGTIEWEIDLHIEELVDSISRLSNTEIVLKQMSFFKSKFQLAKEQRVNKLVVIHGVGEGVLRNEIRTFLQKQTAIEFMDADFRKYGHGATEIVFHPNW